MNRIEVGKLLEAEDKFLIVGHIAPDGDCIGSVLALTSMLKNLGKQAYPACLSSIPEKYDFLSGIEHIITKHENIPQDIRVLVILDCAELSRAGLEESFVVNKLIINIDHHSTNSHPLGVAWVDHKYVATGQQLLRLAEDNNWVIDGEIATALYTSIASDTGFFRFRNATSSAHRDAAKLIDCGAQFRKVAIHLSERKTRSELCLMEKSLSTMEQHYDEKIVTIMIKKEFHERCGTSIDDGEGIVDLARSIPGAAVAILLREVNESTTRVSMRSEENVNVGAIAKSLGGGGHKVAAGCTLHHSIDEAKQIVINLVGKELP